MIARADASTAWCVNQAAVRATIAAWLPEPTAREIFGDPGAICANGPNPGRAVPVAGGYWVSGRWDLASGVRHATWLCANVVVDEDGRRRGLMVLLPSGDATVEDTWHVAGLRGTGSDSFSVEDVFVPADRAVSFEGAPRVGGPIYAIGTSLCFAYGFATVVMGTARAALDDLRELAGAKRPRDMKGLLREQPQVQAQVARSEARLRAARALLRQTTEATWREAEARGDVCLDGRVAQRLAATHAMNEAADVVDAAYRAAGATAVYASSPLQRRFQDASVARQHIQARQQHYETVGQHLLGLEVDPRWL